MHFNQILSKFNIYYPQYLNGTDIRIIKKRRCFRKFASKFIIDISGRLCIKNPVNAKTNNNDIYKIPLLCEKETIVKNIHNTHNHSGRNLTVQILLQNNWYWHGINTDVLEIIKSCPGCTTHNKFKKIIKKSKIIMDDGPHFRYIADIWQLPTEIFNFSGFKYIIDIIDHFTKWYYGYLLENKEGKNVIYIL